MSSSLHQAGSGSLNGVLVVTVEDQSGVTVYHGDLSGLSFDDSAPLTPGASAHYTVRVAWPQTGSSNAYQGQSLSFDLHASAQAP